MRYTILLTQFENSVYVKFIKNKDDLVFVKGSDITMTPTVPMSHINFNDTKITLKLTLNMNFT